MIAERLASRRSDRSDRSDRLVALGSREVRARLEPYARARSRQAAPNWAIRAIVAGVAVDLVLLLAAFGERSLRLAPGLIPPLLVRSALDERYWMIVPPILLAVVAGLFAALRRTSLERVAREIDARLELRERVSTALELEGLSRDRSSEAGPFSRRQRADAVAALRRFEPSEVFPIRLVRLEILGLSATLLLLVGLVLIPAVAGRDQRLAAMVARAEAERLLSLADELGADGVLTPEDRAALSQALSQAAENLQSGSTDDPLALDSLLQSERALAQQSSASAADSELALARVADALDQSPASREVAARLDRGDYPGAAQELARLGKQAGGLSDSERGSLSSALSRAAKGAARLDPALAEKLNEAAAALGSGSQATAESALNEAGKEVARAGSDAARQQALDRALAALQGAKQALNQARTGASALTRAEAGPLDGQDGLSSSDSGMYPDWLGSGGDQGDSASGLGGMGEGLGEPGGSSAGEGSLENRGPSEAGEFRSHQVKVPTSDFGDPSITPSQSADEGPVGAATVDYRQVLSEYRDRATEAMAQRYVPPSLKDLVSAYFTALASGDSAGGASR